MNKTALLLVDIQNDYFPDGRMELHEPIQAAANARKVLDFFRNKNLPVIHIQHISLHPNATFFVKDTDGVIIHEMVEPFAGECVIQKHYPNSFRDTSLLKELQETGIEKLVICGMMSQMCIDATTRAAIDLGFQCTVIENACTSPDVKMLDRVIPAMDVHGTIMFALSCLNAKVETADSFLQTPSLV